MDQEILYPSCFPSLQGFENWRRSIAQCGRADKAVTICTDCTPRYQFAMKCAGRCANPQAGIVFDEDGCVVGMAT